MKVFVTGGSGFVGRRTVPALIAAGHSVVGLARSEASEKALKAQGAETIRGDLENLDALRKGAKESDGIIHLGFIHDFSNMTKSGEIDLAAINAISETIQGTDKSFIITGGTLMGADGANMDENYVVDPSTAVGTYRVPSEEAVQIWAKKGVRIALVRLSPTVHGDGDQAFVPFLIHAAKKAGFSVYTSDTGVWPAIHVDDAANLFVLAVEKAQPGKAYHGIGELVKTKDIAELVGKKLGVETKKVPKEEAGKYLEWLALFFTRSNPASSEITKQTLGWKPQAKPLLQDMDEGTYFQ